METRDQESLAAISEEELRLQSEEDLFATSDYKPQLTAEELNALDAQADEVEAALSGQDDLEPIDGTTDELESLEDATASDDELEGIDE